MIRVVYSFAISGLLLSTISASAQSEAVPAAVHQDGASALSSVPIAAETPITTRLSAIVFDEPVSEEGFATVRIANETGEAVYRGMIPVAAGARSVDLSTVRIPAAGRYTVRVIYPGGIAVEELETPYTIAGAAKVDDRVAGQ